MTLIVFVIALIVAMVSVRGLRASLSSQRDALTTPRTATGQVAAGVGLGSGLVEIQGTARAAAFCPTIVSPLSHQTCVWWSADFERKNDDSWSKKHTITSAPWFCVDDGTGPTLVSLLDHRPEAETNVHHDSSLPKWMTAAHLSRVAQGERIGLETPPPGYVEPSLGNRIVRGIRPGFDENEPIATLGGTWRVVEHFIPSESAVYVIGPAAVDASLGTTVLRPVEGLAFRVSEGSEADVIEAAAGSQRAALVLTTIASAAMGISFPLTHWTGLSVVNWIAAIALPAAIYFGLQRWIRSHHQTLTQPDLAVRQR